MNRLRLYILFVLTGLVSHVHAQEFHVSDYRSSQGLKGTKFGEIAQDRLGFMWVASNAGLFRFDGQQIRKVQEGEFSSLIKRDDGTIWTSSTEGVFSVSTLPDTAIIKLEMHLKNPTGTPQPKLYEDSKGVLWVINSEIIFKENRETNNFKPYTLLGVPHMRFEMVEDDFGNLWLASSQGSIIYRYSPRDDLFRKITIIPHIGAVNCMFNAGQGRIWLGGATLYEIKIDRRLETLRFQRIVTPESAINHIVQGPMQNIFIGMEGGGLKQLFLRDTINELETVRDYTNPYQVIDLDFKKVNHMYVGHDDDLWVSTENGLTHLHQNLFGALQEIPREPVRSIAKTFDGTVYVGTKNLYSVTRHNNQYFQQPVYLPEEVKVSSLAGQHKDLWIGTADGELYNYYEGMLQKHVDKDSTDLKYIYGLMPTKNDVWLFQEPPSSDFVGVYQYSNGALKHWGSTDGFISRAVVGYAVSDSLYYFGGQGNMSYLYEFDAVNQKVTNISRPLPFEPKKSLKIFDLAVDHLGDVWLASTEGLLKYHKETDNVSRVHLGENFTYGDITAIEILPDSSVWLSTKIFGLIRIHENDFAVFDESSGLTIKSFNPRTMLMDNEGFLWMGTPQGIEVSQVPFPDPKPTNQPMVVEVRTTSGALPINFLNTYEVPSDSRVSFKFLSLAYPPEDIQYQVLIADMDSSWVAVNDENEITYKQLAEGKHQILVRCKQRGGHTWSEPITLQVKVNTIWYKRWEMIVLYFVLLGIAIWQFIKWNQRRLKHKNEQLEALVIERTKEITNQKEEIEAQKDTLEGINQRLNELNHEKNYYIGVVAHDLKSPLNRIKALVELINMESDTFSDSVKQYLHLIETSVEHQRAIVTDILDLQAIEAQKINFHLKNFEIRPFIQEVVDSFFGSAQQKYIELHFESDLSTDVMATADPHYYQQIVENLVSNAIKFSPQGREITVSLSNTSEMATVSVKDQGPGLSDEDKSKLFQKFQKLSARPTGGEKSNGLGLAIVKQFAEAMGGRVWCESTWGKGATFFVEIPLSTPSEASSAITDSPNSSEA